MTEYLLIGLATIVILGIAGQWLAWRLHLPSILLLLIAGIVVGPLFGVVNPDKIFGDVLLPIISISVAIILFEGGLSLKIDELRHIKGTLSRLLTIGILITWALTSISIYFLIGLQWQLSVLLGALFVVSGPTVIVPLLRHVRPRANIASLLKWEGIVNDPIGAILAVLVFQLINTGSLELSTTIAITGILKAILFGSIFGAAGAVLVIILLRRYWIPDYLHNPVTLTLLILCYTAANHFQHESGLLSVTIMGIIMANQHIVSIRHIIEFKENLRVLLISSVFIVLAARLPVDQLFLLGGTSWIFIAFLILIVRPAAVFISTIGDNLTLKEKLFLSWMAPKGVVAAAVASIFALRLAESNFAGYELIVPLTFQVIICTAFMYGLTAAPIARILKVAKPDPQGVLFVGAHQWARKIASALKTESINVEMVDTNWGYISAARRDGISAHYANILSEDLFYDIPLDGIGRLVAVTSNDEVNSLAAIHFIDIFGSSEVYQLSKGGQRNGGRKWRTSKSLHGRFLFKEDATYIGLRDRFNAGAKIKTFKLKENVSFVKFTENYPSALPLFVLAQDGKLQPIATDIGVNFVKGDKVISLIDEAAG